MLRLIIISVLFVASFKPKEPLVIEVKNRSLSSNLYHSDTIMLHYADSIRDTWPEFMGKFKKGDPIEFINLDETNYEGIDVDDGFSRLDGITNATKGFKLYAYINTYFPPSYPETTRMSYYPVYVVNESQHDRYFTLKDNYVFALQEAMNRDGKWYPIEKRGPEECLNGKWSIKVRPKEFAVFLMNKYGGSFKTKIRVRLKIGRMTYFSEPFDGYINENQFYIKRNWFIKALSEDREFMCQFWFYGSVPLQAATIK